MVGLKNPVVNKNATFITGIKQGVQVAGAEKAQIP